MLRLRLLTRPLPCHRFSVVWPCPLLSMRGGHSSFSQFSSTGLKGPESDLSCFSGGENDLDNDVSECVLLSGSESDLDGDVLECVVAGMSPSSGLT